MSINNLPDALLPEILAYLPTKESVATSVLSKRWKSLWLLVPGLDLEVFNSSHLPPITFINKFLDKEPPIHKFTIRYDDYIIYPEKLRVLVAKAIDRGIPHLDIHRHTTVYYIKSCMPQSMFNCGTLVCMKLVSVCIEAPKSAVSLPCVKTMQFENMLYDDEDPLIVEKLVSGCPVLEDFIWSRLDELFPKNVMKFVHVKSKTLKRFHLSLKKPLRGTLSSVEIDAPQLEYLKFDDDQSDMIVVKNLSSLLTVDIGSHFNYNCSYDVVFLGKRKIIHDFLTGISGVRNLIVSQKTLEVIFRLCQFQQIPIFENVYSLEAPIYVLEMWPVFLKDFSFPNLKKLILDGSGLSAEWEIEAKWLPVYLVVQLESIEVKELIIGKGIWKKLWSCFQMYLLVGLKKLVLHFKVSDVISEQDSVLFSELHRYLDCLYGSEIIIYQGINRLY